MIKNNFFFYLKHFAFYYIGFLAFAFPIYFIYILLSYFIKKDKYRIYLLNFFSIILVSIFIVSIYNFEKEIKINEFEIYSSKINNEYNILHISDVQYGSVSSSYLEKIRKSMDYQIEKNNIDFIVFTGDFIDTGNYNEADLEKLFDFKIPVFFSIGNHEFYHNEELILDIVKRNYITLRNQSSIFGEINIIGIDDNSQKNYLDIIFKNNLNLIDENKFNILLYHRPEGIEYARINNVDLMLTGHTHGGQIFPYTLALKFIYEYPQGLIDFGDFYLYTTDGVGLWGPKLRLGTRNEMAIFTLKPN